MIIMSSYRCGGGGDVVHPYSDPHGCCEYDIDIDRPYHDLVVVECWNSSKRRKKTKRKTTIIIVIAITWFFPHRMDQSYQ